MRVYQLVDFGGSEVLEQTDLDIPEPGPTEVRVSDHATSVSPLDIKIREHDDDWGLSASLVVGYDVSGVVGVAGATIERFEPGDEVLHGCTVRGRYIAEYHVEWADIVAHKPDHLSHAEATGLPLVSCTTCRLSSSGLTSARQHRPRPRRRRRPAGRPGRRHRRRARPRDGQSTDDRPRVPTRRRRRRRLHVQRIVYRRGQGGDCRGVDVVLDSVGGDVVARSPDV